jgi:hypothetical protein
MPRAATFTPPSSAALLSVGRRRLFIALLLLTFIGAGCASADRARVARERAPVLRETTRRAEPVVAAVQAYRAKHGRPPATLGALVPVYLKTVPAPGPLASGGWYYEVGNRPAAGGWSLYLMVNRRYSDPQGFGDVFAYHPSGRYERADYGGVLERVGAWGYYHE